MNKFNFSNVMKLFAFDFKNNCKQIFGWSIALASIMFIYMFMFPFIQEIATVDLGSMPPELLQLVGMESMADMGNYVSLYGIIYGMIMLITSIFSAIFGANLIFKEEKSKSIEFLSSLYVSRTEIYLAKFLTMFSGVLLVVISASVCGISSGFINGGETFNLMELIQISIISGIIPFIFGSVSLMIAGISNKLGTPIMGSATVLVCYMTGYLGNLLGENGTIIKYFSPFECFNATNALLLESTLFIQLACYGFIIVGSVIAGITAYRKRDFVI